MWTRLHSRESYSHFINSHPASLIHFRADWNSHDLQLQDELEELRPKFDDRVGFANVDVDEEGMHDICRQVGLKNVPALAYYRRVRLVRLITGLESRDRLKDRLRDLLSAAPN